MKTIALFIALISASMASAQKLYITVGDRTATATLASNQATERLKANLSEGAVSIKMNDYGGFEKVGDLPWSLPTSDRQITTSPGDIMLYVGDNIVFFYGTNSWAYTPLGKFDDMTASDIKSFLAGGQIELTLSLTPTTGVEGVRADKGGESTAYDLSGRPVSADNMPAGVYIINGKKHIVRK